MGYYNYILSGLGKLEGTIYQNTEKLFNILEKNGSINKLMNIPQLGAIMYTMPGARHTRYEYVILQFDLINKSAPYKANEYISISKKMFKYINNSDAPFSIEGNISITLGDMLQILAIVSNIGYTRNTFLDAKLMLRFLREDKEFKKKYKYSLGSEFYHYLDDFLEKNDYWSFQYLNSVIILRGLINNHNKDLIHTVLNIIDKYLNCDKDNPIKDEIQIFKNIKTLAFTIMDLNFSPLPLNFNSNNITSIIEKIVSRHSDKSNENSFLNDITALLEKNIYLEPNNLLNMACLEKQLYKAMLDVDLKKRNIIKQFLSRESILFSEIKINEKWSKNILKLDIPIEKEYIRIKDVVDKLAAVNGIVAYSFRYRTSALMRVCISLKEGTGINKIEVLKKVYKHVFEIIEIFEGIGTTAAEIKVLLAKFYLKNIFLQNNIYLESKINRYDYDFISIVNGVSKTKSTIEKYFEKDIEKDQKYEILTARDRLEDAKFSGLTVFFMCSVKIKNKKNEDIAELDGMILYPNKAQIIITEAKNKRSSEREAEEALQEKIDKLKLESIGSIESVKIKKYERGYYSSVVIQL